MRALLASVAGRYLSRRLTRVLVGLALVATTIAGVAVFANAEELTPERAAAARAQRAADVAHCAQVTVGSGGDSFAGDRSRAEAVCRRHIRPEHYDRRLHLTDLWPADGGDPILAVTTVFLAIAALVGGASMIGAEWKANTFTTLLTWEPRRTRLAVAKIAIAGLLAAVIAVALQLVFSAALLPTVALRGTTEGADALWLRGATGALLRSATLTGLAAVVGASVAMIGRSTAAALGVAFAYLAVGEAVVRAWKPELTEWLVGENSAIFLTGRRLEGVPFERSVVTAALTLASFALALAAVATVTLRRRDVAA